MKNLEKELYDDILAKLSEENLINKELTSSSKARITEIVAEILCSNDKYSDLLFKFVKLNFTDKQKTYTVVCNKTNNSSESIAKGILNVDISLPENLFIKRLDNLN